MYAGWSFTLIYRIIKIPTMERYFSGPGSVGASPSFVQASGGKYIMSGNCSSGDCVNAIFAMHTSREGAVFTLPVCIRRGKKKLSIRVICDLALLKWHITSREQKDNETQRKGITAVQHEQGHLSAVSWFVLLNTLSGTSIHLALLE